MKTITNNQFNQLYINFDHFLRVKNYKLGNGNLYQGVVAEFLFWLERNGIEKIEHITQKETIAYLEYLSNRPKIIGQGCLAEKTIKFHLFTLGLHLKNLIDNQSIENSIYLPSTNGSQQKPRDFLTTDEIRTVFTHCTNKKEKALLSIAYGCGLRRSEIVALNIKDIQLLYGVLIVKKGKNNKRREVPMSETVINYIKDYLLTERFQFFRDTIIKEEAVFINSKGKRMSGDSLNVLLKKMILQTKDSNVINKDITLHCLRHSIAAHLAENNAGIEFIPRFLGHSEINTTYIYAIKNKRRNSLLSLNRS
jgi:integrase/recombinase XerD